MYYNDPLILKNREILKKYNTAEKLRKEAKKNKIEYFVNR